MRIPIIFAVIAVLVVPRGACSEYRIGVIAPLTAQAASFGQHMRKGIELAQAKHGAGVQVIYEDDQSQTAKTIAAFQRLVDRERVQAVFVFGSAAGNAAAPLAEKKGILLFAVGASDARIPVGRHLVFLHWVTPEAEAKLAVDEAVRRGYRRLGVLTSEHEGLIALETAFAAELARQGLGDRLQWRERTAPDEKDFSAIIARVRTKNLDGVCALLYPDALAVYAKRARAAGLDAALFGIDTFEDAGAQQGADGALGGKWYVSGGNCAPWFEAEYQERYHEPPGIIAANGYDAFALVAETIAKVGEDNQQIAGVLRNTKDFQGAWGTYSATGDGRFDLPAGVQIVPER